MSGLMWMAFASAMFSAMTLLARMSADYASWALVAAVRAWVGVAVALGVALASRRPIELHNRSAAWARSLLGTAAMCLSFYALGAPEIAIGDIATIRATSPVLIAVLAAAFLRERPGRAVYLAVPLAFVGVVILVEPSLEVSGGLALLTLLSAIFSAGAMVFLRRLGPGESPEAVAAHFGVVAGISMTVVAFWQGSVPDVEGGLLVLGTGLAGGIGQLSMTRAYAKEKAATVSAMGYLSVVLTHVAAFVFLDEPFGPARAVGATLVILSGWWLILARARTMSSFRAGAPKSPGSDPQPS